MPEAFLALGLNTVALVPISFLALVLISVALAVLINRTPLGMKLRLVGANPTAARFSGISNRRVLLLTYVVSGLLAGGAGIIIASRSASASPDYGSSYLLLAIVIAILGGTNPFGGLGTVPRVVLPTVTLPMVASGVNIMRFSPFEDTNAPGGILGVGIALGGTNPFGGYGTVLGVVLATVTLQMVSSGFNIMRLSPFEYTIAQGVILVVVMALDVTHRRRQARAAAPPTAPDPARATTASSAPVA